MIPEETYLGWGTSYSPEDMKLVCVYKTRHDMEYKQFEKNVLLKHTRLCDYVIVDEELQEIQKLSQQMAEGEYQDTDWVQIDSGVENEDFVDRLEQDYQRNTYRPQYQQREYRPRNNYQNNYNNRY